MKDQRTTATGRETKAGSAKDERAASPGKGTKAGNVKAGSTKAESAASQGRGTKAERAASPGKGTKAGSVKAGSVKAGNVKAGSVKAGNVKTGSAAKAWPTSALVEYGTAVADGKIRACDKVRRVYGQLLEDMAKGERNGRNGRWHFDQEKAKRPIAFIERFCRQSQGVIGAPIRLELFQKAKFEALFGFVDDDGWRRYTECLTIEGRKNGKTTEMAAVANYMLVADGEGAPEVYFAATKREQATKGTTEMWHMVQQSPALRSAVTRRVDGLHCYGNFGIAKALASNTNSLDGLNGSCIIIDELAAIKNRDLYDLLKQSLSAKVRRQPLLFEITTSGFVRNSIYDSQYEYASAVIRGTVKDERFLPLVYELDERGEINDPRMWIKANPGLGTIKDAGTLKENVEKANKDPAFLPTVLTKDFNVVSSGASAWLKYEDVVNRTPWKVPEGQEVYCIGGFDAADSVDLTAACAVLIRPDDEKMYVRSMYWIPQAVLDRDAERGSRAGRDNAPYDLWVQQGLMRTVPGNKVDKKVILDWYEEIRGEGWYTMFIGYDPWHIDDTLLREFGQSFGEQCMEKVRQGVLTMSQPMKDMAADMAAGKVLLGDRNPITEMCLLNTKVKTDVNGNIQPVKGLDTRMRIDGAVALICAYIALRDHRGDVIGLNDGVQILAGDAAK